jgi:hypothetical protein
MIPAGNLSEQLVIPEDANSLTHLWHYLEALSRLKDYCPIYRFFW